MISSSKTSPIRSHKSRAHLGTAEVCQLLDRSVGAPPEAWELFETAQSTIFDAYPTKSIAFDTVVHPPALLEQGFKLWTLRGQASLGLAHERSERCNL